MYHYDIECATKKNANKNSYQKYTFLLCWESKEFWRKQALVCTIPQDLGSLIAHQKEKIQREQIFQKETMKKKDTILPLVNIIQDSETFELLQSCTFIHNSAFLTTGMFQLLQSAD